MSPDVAQGFITIDGQAEVRVKPTEIRIVLAVTAEGQTPDACQKLVAAKADKLRAVWIERGIPADNIVDDFIAVLPRYEFHMEKHQQRDVAVERKVGYLMQTNLHVAVKDDAAAMQVVKIAFENDVPDIIAFDYWSKELDALKIEARAQAVKAAREKSDVLLGALFADKPAVISTVEVSPEDVSTTISWLVRSIRIQNVPPAGRLIESVTRPLGVTVRLMCHHLGWGMAWTRGTAPTAWA